MKFECHITMKPEHEAAAAKIGKKFGFKSSKIAGDEIMGDGTFFYLTKTDVVYETIKKDMHACAATLRVNKVPYLREKIELVLYDHRIT